MIAQTISYRQHIPNNLDVNCMFEIHSGEVNRDVDDPLVLGVIVE